MNLSIKHILTGESRIVEIIRFGLTGVLATGIQYGLYVVFVGPVHLSAQMATVVSYVISFVFNFFLSNYFTFHSKPTAEKGIGFTISHAINLGLQVGLVSVFNTFMPARLAMLPVFGICIPTNFLLVRFVLKSPKFQNAIDKLNIRAHLMNYRGLKHLLLRHSKIKKT